MATTESTDSKMERRPSRLLDRGTSGRITYSEWKQQHGPERAKTPSGGSRVKAGMQSNGWTAALDESTGRMYFYHESGESVWEKPEDFEIPPAVVVHGVDGTISPALMSSKPPKPKLEEVQCSNCDDIAATIRCPVCDDAFCHECAMVLHKNPKKKPHVDVFERLADSHDVVKVAVMAVRWKRIIAARKAANIQWIRAEFLQYEKTRQRELQAEIDRLAGELSTELEKGKEDITDMLKGLAGISEQHKEKVKKEAVEDTAESELKRIWDHHETSTTSFVAANKLNREAQRLKLQKRLKSMQVEAFNTKVAEINASIEAKRTEAKEKIAQTENTFMSLLKAQDVVWKLIRRRGFKDAIDGKEVEDAAELAAWEILVDEASGANYFYNSLTNESRWDEPPGWSERMAADRDPEGTVDEASAVAEEWVTSDVLEKEQAASAEMEARITELTRQLAEAKEGAAHDALDFLGQLLDMDDDEEIDQESELEVLHSVKEADVKRLAGAMASERDRQRARLMQRLEDERQKRLGVTEVMVKLHQSIAKSVIKSFRRDLRLAVWERRKKEEGISNPKLMRAVLRVMARHQRNDADEELSEITGGGGGGAGRGDVDAPDGKHAEEAEEPESKHAEESEEATESKE